MFRRKEDSLFDSTTDSNQLEPMESASVVSQPSSSSSSSPAGSSSSSAMGSASSSMSSSSAQPLSRPASAAAPQPASAFRPSAAPLGGDMGRNRMPEAKSSSSSSSAPISSNKSGKRVLTVGNDILLKGEIATCDRLVIEGKVDATLNDVHTVEIAESGSFKGSAHIEDAEISGIFEGDLIVRGRLVIYATGKVRGKITYGEIEIERGGELSGEIKTSNQSSAQGSRVRKDEKVAA